MDYRHQEFSILSFVLIALVLFMVMQNFLLIREGETIPYSQFKSLVKNGLVADLVLEQEKIRGKIKPAGAKQLFSKEKLQQLIYDGKTSYPFATIRVEDSRLTAELENAGIPFRGEVARSWLPTLLSWIAPVALFFLLWSYLMKKMTAGTGMMQVGKSKAKVYIERTTGVSFADVEGIDEAARVRDLFAQAVEHAPSIIFIDEFDALGKARGINVLSSQDEREQTLNQLLGEMDGFDPNHGVIIMAATNRPEILDAALLRPGRFDRQVLVDRPDIKGRENILKLHAKKITLSPSVDLGMIAAKTPGFVGADLANIVNEAALLAAREGKDAVEMADLDEAIERVVAGLQKKTRIMSAQEKKMVAFHESGHALVAELVPGADPVLKVSIVPRGVGALGYTQQRPTEDRYLLTHSELLARIHVLLGGRVAEEIIFRDASTGAQNDLQKATEIARTMVTQFGMSDRVGLVALEGSRTPLFLPVPAPVSKEYSGETAKLVDVEVKRILSETHAKVRDLLLSNRQALEQLAQLVLEKESIDRAQLRAILTLRPLDTAV